MHTANFRRDTLENNSKISTAGVLRKVRKHDPVTCSFKITKGRESMEYKREEQRTKV